MYISAKIVLSIPTIILLIDNYYYNVFQTSWTISASAHVTESAMTSQLRIYLFMQPHPAISVKLLGTVCDKSVRIATLIRSRIITQ